MRARRRLILQAFTLSNVSAAREQSGQLYQEFLRVPTMSAGLYQLNAGTIDLQQPHTEDELYYVVQGRAHLAVGDEDVPVEPGSLIFVAANVPHRFHTITGDLTVLVFFAPAEDSYREKE
jgi:mannose-6-phosphate isomerase-like protein (cupin superfamily)